MMTQLKIGLAVCGLVALLYFLWPAIRWMIQMSILRLIFDYGFYALLFLAGGGWLWWKTR